MKVFALLIDFIFFIILTMHFLIFDSYNVLVKSISLSVSQWVAKPMKCSNCRYPAFHILPKYIPTKNIFKTNVLPVESSYPCMSSFILFPSRMKRFGSLSSNIYNKKCFSKQVKNTSLYATSSVIQKPSIKPTTDEHSYILSNLKKKMFDLQFRIDKNIFNLMQQKKMAIEKALDAAVPVEAANTKSKNLNEAMRYSLLSPAKRVRPLLCLLVCQLFQGDEEKCMPTAVAIEMIHTMSLVHDDLPALDNDCLRRGRASCHVAYSEDIAILVGDALLAAAFEHLVKFSEKFLLPETILRLVKKLSTVVGCNGLAAGQTMDLAMEGRENVLLDDLLWIHKHKTGILLKAAAAAGAIVAGANEKDINKVEEYAENVGLAFQICDDILDITQSTGCLGKTAGKDLKSCKITYPKLVGIDKSKEAAQILIAKALESIDSYKERAYPLVGIAEYVLSRTK